MNKILQDRGGRCADPVETVKSSLRCFVLSLVGLIPVLGIPSSLAAIIQTRKVKRAAGSEWNPAARYLSAAGWIAPLGFLTSAGFLAAVCIFASAFGEGPWAGSSGYG